MQKVKFTGNLTNGKIAFVKPLRNATGIGLKEACDIADSIINKGETTVEFTEWRTTFGDIVEMKNAGIIVTIINEQQIINSKMKEKIKKLICEAIEIDRLEIAEKLLFVLKGI